MLDCVRVGCAGGAWSGVWIVWAKDLLLVLYFYVFDSRGPKGTVESLGACKNAGLVVANGLLFGREGRWVRVSGAIGRGAVLVPVDLRG